MSDEIQAELIEELKYELEAARAQREFLEASFNTFAYRFALLTFAGFLIAGFYPNVCGFLFILFPVGIGVYCNIIEHRVNTVIPPYRSIATEEMSKVKKKK